jgi:hypothetical protein
VTYDLSRLGEREFEEICRALAVRVLGDNIQAFGDGPDGGRELAWEGTVAYPGSDSRAHWSGYGVLQAKFRRQNVGTKDLEWLRGQLRDEFAAWLNPAAARVRWGRTPEYLIVTTNVRLSSVAGSGGIDQVRALLAGQAQQLGLKGWAIWDANQICVYLDAYSSIAQRFTALITPSDVLAELKLQAAVPRVVNVSVNQVAAPVGNADALCPACSTQGMSRRMTAVYADERRVTSTRVNGRTYRTVTVSDLGRSVAPPQVPGFPLLLLIVALCSGGGVLNGMSQMPRLLLARAPETGATVTLVLVAAAVAAVTIPMAVRGVRAVHSRRPRAQLARWLWHRTWCCRRCDIAWVATAELPRRLWGRPFRTRTTTASLHSIAQGILNDRQRQQVHRPTGEGTSP